MNTSRKNITTIIIILLTLVLAGVAIFTAIRLYQTRQGTIAPNVPSIKKWHIQVNDICWIFKIDLNIAYNIYYNYA